MSKKTGRPKGSSVVDMALMRERILEGMTSKQLAESFGVCIWRIYQLSDDYREQLLANARLHRSKQKLAVKELRKREKKEIWESRYEPMRQMYLSGKTYAEIASTYEVSRQRVQQIMKRFGISAKDGGSHVAKSKRDLAKPPKTNKFAERVGATKDEYLAIKAHGLLSAYRRQKENAKLRGIEWNFTLPSWFSVWQQSGHLHERGRQSGKYVMSRIGDSGPYAPDNVVIKTCNENCSEATKQWIGKNKTNKGVFAIRRGSDKPFIAKVGRKYIGVFATEHEALIARAQYLQSAS